MRHTGREVLRESVNVGGRDDSAVRGGRIGHVGGVRGDEVLGEVVENRRQAVVLVESGEGTGCQLQAVSKE